MISLKSDIMPYVTPANQSRKDDKRTVESRRGDAATAVSHVLRRARLSRHLSQQKLAAKLGLRQRQISDVERGVVDARLSTIQNVARALDLELMLIPRQLISTVEALQRAGRDAGRRPLYALDDEDAEAAPDQSHVELGDTRAISRDTRNESRTRKGPGS
jgi:transcriptional regulator with XRE-family HTH domain